MTLTNALISIVVCLFLSFGVIALTHDTGNKSPQLEKPSPNTYNIVKYIDKENDTICYIYPYRSISCVVRIK